ncbi:MAG: hypothetical protein Q7U51_13135 [Methanoregula sp.]|nr:hypothetical protein [Methanoregula sp.]
MTSRYRAIPCESAGSTIGYIPGANRDNYPFLSPLRHIGEIPLTNRSDI